MTGTKMTNALTNETYNHQLKDDVDDFFVMAPPSVPDWLKEPEVLCNEISRREKRRDSQLCRYAITALPIELDDDKNIDLIRKFCEIAFVLRGMMVLVAVHGLGTNNPHAHILITMRSFDVTLGGFGLKEREWNSPEMLLSQRKVWEVVCNQFLEQSGFSQRISCETYEKQGIEKAKQKHMGSFVHKLYKDEGVIFERSAQYSIDIETKNLANINKEIAEIELEMIALRLEDENKIADVDSKQTPDFGGKLDEQAQSSQLKPVTIPPVVAQHCSEAYTGPTFDLSRVYGRGFQPKIVRAPSKYSHNFDEEMMLNPSVPIIRIGLASKKPEMTLRQRIQLYINKQWPLEDLLPDSLILELGFECVIKEINEIQGEHRLDFGFSFVDIEDGSFTEDSERNRVVDETGKAMLKRDFNDLFRDYVPDEDLTPPPTPFLKPSQSESRGMSP